MKKGGLVTLFLAIALVFCAGQFVSAATIDVAFSGPYETNQLPGIGIPVGDLDLVNTLVICQTVDLTHGYEVPSPDPSLPAGTRTFVWKVGEVDGFPDFEVFSSVHTLNASDLVPDLEDNQNLWVYKWWNQVDTGPLPPGVTSYLHFYDGTIQGIKYFDVTFMTDDTSWDPSDISVHPTPIPSALLLLGSGFVGLVGLRRFRKK